MERYEQHEVIELDGGKGRKKRPSKIGAILLMLLALIYLLSPIDLIPDVIPILGWLDDAGISIYAILRLIRALKGK